MAKTELPAVPIALVQYLHIVYPKTHGLVKTAAGEWENPLDAAKRAGHGEVINFLLFLHELQTKGDLSDEEREKLMVDIAEDGTMSLIGDGYVLRAAR